jgi:dimethylargininase
MSKAPVALIRRPGPELAHCELSYLAREAIDIQRAAEQHAQDARLLGGLGARIIELPARDDLPDAVFVEDHAVVLDEVAVIGRMRSPVRHMEGPSVAVALGAFRRLAWVTGSATLEAGDVIRIGSSIFAGISGRTDLDGIRQLSDLLTPFGYSIRPVTVTGCMHLKTGCCYVGNETVLANSAWLDLNPLKAYRILSVPADEPFGANVLKIGETVLVPESCPKTRDLLEHNGWRTVSVDISELAKAEAGLTCLSILIPSP